MAVARGCMPELLPPWVGVVMAATRGCMPELLSPLVGVVMAATRCRRLKLPRLLVGVARVTVEERVLRMGFQRGWLCRSITGQCWNLAMRCRQERGKVGEE